MMFGISWFVKFKKSGLSKYLLPVIFCIVFPLVVVVVVVVVIVVVVVVVAVVVVVVLVSVLFHLNETRISESHFNN